MPNIDRNSRLLAMLLAAVALLLLGKGAFAGEHALIVNDDREQPLKLRMTQPWYRHTIFASRPVDTVKVAAYPSVHINPGILVGSRLKLTVTNTDGEVFAAISVHNPALSFLIRGEIDVKDLPAGSYMVTAQLFDSNGEPIADVKSHPCIDAVALRKLPPAPHEVVFDRQGICYVDGEPFFPIGMFHIWPGVFGYMNSVRQEKGQEPLDWEGWYRLLKDAGFNSFQDWQGGREPAELLHRFDIAKRLGFRAQVHPTEDRDFETLRNHGGLLGWYTFDEPMLHNTTEQMLRERYEKVLKLDPYHPQIITDNMPVSLATIAPYVDVLMYDLYPQGGGDMRIVGKATAYARTLKGGGVPAWPTIQAFQLSNYTRKADGTMYDFGRLTEDEMRSTVFDSVACGATGIFYYGYYSSEGPQTLPDGSTRRSYIIDDFPDQWQAIRRINRELKLIVPAVVSGKRIATSLAPANSEVNAATFIDGDRAIVLVANPTRGEQSVVIGVPGLGDQTGRDLFSDATAASQRSRVKVSLPSLQVRAYVFELWGGGN